MDPCFNANTRFSALNNEGGDAVSSALLAALFYPGVMAGGVWWCSSLLLLDFEPLRNNFDQDHGQEDHGASHVPNPADSLTQKEGAKQSGEECF